MQFKGKDNACLGHSLRRYQSRFVVFANLEGFYKMYSDHEIYSL